MVWLVDDIAPREASGELKKRGVLLVLKNCVVGMIPVVRVELYGM